MRISPRYMLLTVAAFVAVVAVAAPVPIEHVQQLAGGIASSVQVSYSTGAAVRMAQAVSPSEVSVSPVAPEDSDETAFYVIDRGATGGFVVMSADDRLEPVLVIAPTGKFDFTPGTPMYDILCKDVALRMEYADEEGLPCSEKWQALLSPAESGCATPAGGVDISDLEDLRRDQIVQSQWSQSYAWFYDAEKGWIKKAIYNYYTPPNAAGSVGNYVCGCVATAGSQIMRYHKFPTADVKAVTRTCYVNGSSTSKTMKGGKYDWANMPLVPDELDSVSDDECRAIGKLTYDVGVSIGMSWASGGSGAFGADLAPAFTDVFGYKNAIYWQQSQQSTLSDASIKNALLANFDAKCPVELSISNNGKSNFHSIVADGYGYIGSSLYVHLNMGWAGSDDAWYNLPGIGTSSGFSFIDGVVYNIFPKNKGDLITGRVLDSDGNPVEGATVQALDGSAVAATVTTDSVGIYALYLDAGAEGREYVVEASAAGMDTASKNVYLKTSVNHDYYSSQRGAIGNSWGNNLVLTATIVDEVPAIPAGVSASDGTSTAKIRVSWVASAGATSYKVYRATSNSSSAATLYASVTAPYCDDTSAEPGKTYYYWVAACNSIGESDLSSSDSGWRAYAIPSAPASVSASDGTSTAGVTVTWSAVADADSYSVWRAESDSAAKECLVSGFASVTYTDTSAVPGTVYFYWVTATNKGGTSGYSPSDTGYRAVAAPPAPTGVSASYGDSSTEIVVSWSAVATATSYSVWRGTSSSSSAATEKASGLTGTSWSDASATVGTVYYYWVKASNSGGPSDFSEPDAGYLADISGPTSVSASDGDTAHPGYVRITWAASQNATSYEIWRGTSNAYSLASKIGSTASTSYDDASATPGTRYYYWVRAVTNAGTSAFSAPDTGYRPLSVPGNVSATTGSPDGVAVSWSSVTGAASYQVGRGDAGVSAPADVFDAGSSLSYKDATAVPGVTYAYFVRAVGSAGAGPWSASATGSRSVPTPTNLTASDGTYTDRIFVSWPVLSGATSYELMRSDEDDIAYAETIATTSSTTFSDTTAEYGLTYYYFFRANFAVGTSPWSASEAGWRAFPAPENVSATDGTNTGRITVTWDPIDGVSLYQVWRYSGSAKRNELIGTPTSASYNDSKNIVPGTTYKYYVKAVFPTGVSGLSLPDTGYLKSAAPSVVASDGASATSISLSWDVKPGAKAYYVYRGTTTASADATLIATLSMLEGTYTDSDVEHGVLYYYWMKTSTALDTSDFGNSDSGYVGLPGVSSIIATDGKHADRISVTWSAVSGATSYEVWRSASEDSSEATRVAKNVTATSWDDVDATPGSRYWYWVKACDVGPGLFGASDSGWRTLSVPITVTATTNLTEGVKISWKGPTSGVSFEIRRVPTDKPSKVSIVATVSDKGSYTDNTAVPGNEYLYWVRAYTDLSESDWSDSAYGFRAVAAPASVSATDGTSIESVTVTWTAATSAKRYEIWRNTTTKTDTAELLGSTNRLVWVDATAEPGIAYYYWVKTISAIDVSAFSSRDKGYVSTPAPTYVDASDGEAPNLVRVRWAASEGALTYALWRSESDDVSAAAEVKKDIAAATFDDTTVTPGKYYWYWVRPVSEAGPGVFAGPDCGYASLSAPTEVAATSNLEAKVTVSWKKVSGASWYEVFRAETNDVAYATNMVLATTLTASYGDTNAFPAVRYWYWVRAHAEADVSPLGGPADGFRLLTVPTGVSAFDGVSDEYVKIVWNETVGAASYEVWRAQGSTSASAAVFLASVTNELEYLDVSASPAVSYTYWLKASSELHTTGLSSYDKGWRSLPAPEGVTASDGTTPDGVQVDWERVPGAVKYEVWRNAGDEPTTNGASRVFTSADGDVTSCLNTSASAGVKYWFWVRTVGEAGGAGVFSLPDSGFKAVASPSNLKATDGTSYDYVRVTWGSVAGATSYEIQREATNELYSATTNVYSVAGTSFDDTNAVPGVVYRYLVRAVSPLSIGAFAGPEDGYRKLQKIMDVVASDGTSLSDVNVAWTVPAGAAKCNVWRSTGTSSSSAVKIATVDSSTYSDTNALHGVKYYYWVNAVCDVEGEMGSNNDGWRALFAPGEVSVTDGDSTSHARITWTWSPDATKYEVFRGTSDDTSTMTSLKTLSLPAEPVCEDTTATPGTIFYYSVRAGGTGGWSEFGAVDSGFKALMPPSNVVADDGKAFGQVTVKWSAVSGATHYQVFRADGDDAAKAPWSGWQTGTSFVDTSCVGATRYWYYVVAAVDENGTRQSAFSAGDPGYAKDDGSSAAPVDIGGGISWPVVKNGDGTTTTNAISFVSVEGGRLAFAGVQGAVGSKTTVPVVVKDSLVSDAMETVPATLEIVSPGVGELDLSSAWGERPSMFVIGIAVGD